MGKVEDYKTGKILKDVRVVFILFKFLRVPIIGSYLSKKIMKKARKFEPKIINIQEAESVINISSKCAVGERVCRELYLETEFTEEIFLDDLAEALVEVCKAKFVSKEEAIMVLKKYPKNPLILSKVSGKYEEICRSVPEKCVYWNIEKRGLKILENRL